MHLNGAGTDFFTASSRAAENFDQTAGLGGTEFKALVRLVCITCIETSYNGENKEANARKPKGSSTNFAHGG